MAGTMFVKNGRIEPQRDTEIKLNGVHGGYNPHRDGTVKAKQRTAREIEREIADLDNGHANLDDLPVELPVNGKRDPVLERVEKVEAERVNKAFDDEMKGVKRMLNKDRELAKYVGSKFAGMAQDVKRNRRK